MDQGSYEAYSKPATSDEGPTDIDPIRGSEGDIEIDGIDTDISAADLATMEERILSMGSKLRSMPEAEDDDHPGPQDDDLESADNLQDARTQGDTDTVQHKPHEAADSEELIELPHEDDRDIDNSVISEVEIVRVQIRSLQGELAKRDATIAQHASELNRIKFALQSQSDQPKESSKLEDLVRELRTAVRDMRAELTEISTRQQENLQLSEIKMKKELSRAAPAAIIAEKPEVPSSVITPGGSSEQTTSVQQVKKVKKKAVIYN